MRVEAPGRVSVASLTWRATTGGWVFTVIAKLTYRLLPGVCELAENLEPPAEADNHWNDDPRRSVYAPADLAPFKQRPEVTLVGSAVSPSGDPVRSVRTRLLVGDVDKSIEVFCDRAFTSDRALVDGARFVRMAVRWERASGGPDTQNPVGVVHGARDAYGNIAVPNLQPPDLNITSPDDFVPPVGFGPVGASWPARQARLGPHAREWILNGDTDQPMPDDLEPSFFNAAPHDQLLEVLRPDERIVLENLHQSGARLVTSLPGVAPSAFVELKGATPFEVRLQPDTLWIDSDRSLCTLTFRGAVPLSDRTQPGKVRIVLPGDAVATKSRRPKDALTGTLAIEPAETRTATEINLIDVRRALPFAPARGEPGPAAGSSAREELASFRAALPFGRDDAPPSGVAPASPGGAKQAPSAMGVASPAPAPPARVLAAPASSASSPWSRAASVEPAAALPLPTSIATSGSGLGAGLALRGTSSAGADTGVGSIRAFDAASEAAAARGAVAASNAAANAASKETADRAEKAQPSSEPPTAPRPAPAIAIDLLWFDEAAVPRVRASPRFGSVLDGVRNGVGAWWKPGGPEPSVAPSDAAQGSRLRGRADMAAVLSGATAIELSRVRGIVDGSIDGTGLFTPPMVVLSGELAIGFERKDALEAMMALVSPLAAAGDKRLKEAVAIGTELVKSNGWLPPDVFEGAIARLREAFDAAAGRATSASQLDARIERALLLERRFARRRVFGGDRVRATLRDAAGATLCCYLPTAAVERWPLAPRLRARLIVSLHFSEDAEEAGAEAADLIALSREIKRDTTAP